MLLDAEGRFSLSSSSSYMGTPRYEPLTSQSKFFAMLRSSSLYQKYLLQGYFFTDVSSNDYMSVFFINNVLFMIKQFLYNNKSTVMIDISNPQTANLGCPTCTLFFTIQSEHKQHYKSDFHRYNLKRKMVKLAPATLEQYQNKKTITSQQETVEYNCNECRKKFSSAQTLNQHARSKGHNPNMVLEKIEKVEKVPEIYKKNEKKCLFCKEQSEILEQNLKHMQIVHGFFIPQKQFCKDINGLVCYLQQKIEVGFMCITCENKGAKDFSSGEAVRKHMQNKGHFFMKTSDGYEEYENYYDFSKQFTAIVEEQKDRKVFGIQYEKIEVIEDDKIQEEKEEDWEDMDEESESNEDQWEDEGSQEQMKEDEQKQKKVKTKTYYIMKPTVTNNDELLLPNGKILGHRKYKYLYRQNYHQPFELQNQLKALGSDAFSNAVVTKGRLIELMKRERLIKNSKHRADKRHLKVGMQNNLLMKYFRTQNSL